MEIWLVLLLVTLGVGGIAFTLVMSFYEHEKDQRVRMVVGETATKKSFLKGLVDTAKDDRRRKLEQALREMQDKQRKKKRVSLRQRLQRAGLHTSEQQFVLFTLALGVVLGIVGLALGNSIGGMSYGFIGAGAFFLIGIGAAFWLLSFLTTMRMNKFLNLLPDAIELMVRGLRSGLPATDAMRTIAEELPDPVGPEFREVVEGQKIGIPMDKGLERMYERVPLPEVNFLSIAIAIQKETGGNLSEALENLAEVLRERKNMKLKIKAITQEAKVSAIIIGALPFVLIGGIAFLNPGHLDPFFNTQIGQITAIFSFTWMLIGVLLMRKLINFKF